jgi:hypothetical protein
MSTVFVEQKQLRRKANMPVIPMPSHRFSARGSYSSRKDSLQLSPKIFATLPVQMFEIGQGKMSSLETVSPEKKNDGSFKVEKTDQN